MRVTRITPNLKVADLAAATPFYRDFLGLSTQEFDLGWVTRLTAPDTGAHVQLLTHDVSAPEDAAITVHVDDVDAAYAQAQQHNYEIVHSLRTEEWGVRRFLVRAPDGTVINVVQHRD